MFFKITIFAILVVVLFVNSSNSVLTCYGCSASTTSDCYNGVKKAYFQQDCIPPARNMLPFTNLPTNTTLRNNEEAIVTVCIQFSIKDTFQKVYQKGCGFIYEGVDICDYLGNIVNLDGCSYCEDNLCNKGPGTPFRNHTDQEILMMK